MGWYRLNNKAFISSKKGSFLMIKDEPFFVLVVFYYCINIADLFSVNVILDYPYSPEKSNHTSSPQRLFFKLKADRLKVFFYSLYFKISEGKNLIS